MRQFAAKLAAVDHANAVVISSDEESATAKQTKVNVNFEKYVSSFPVIHLHNEIKSWFTHLAQISPVATFKFNGETAAIQASW